MGREIKFRAWDKKEKKMHLVSSLSPNFIMTPRKPNQRKRSDCEIMQFTGLLDKNGREIFEGDIVEFHPFDPNHCEGEYLPRQRFTVDISKLRLWLKEEKFGYEGELLLYPNDCQIIGNINENPELLEAK